MCRRDSEPNDVFPLDTRGHHVEFSRPVDGLKKCLSLRIVALYIHIVYTYLGVYITVNFYNLCSMLAGAKWKYFVLLITCISCLKQLYFMVSVCYTVIDIYL